MAEEHNDGYNNEVSPLPPPLDDGVAILLYILSFFVFLVGIIGGIVLLNSPQQRNRVIGKNMIIIAVVATLICCGVYFSFMFLPYLLAALL